MSGVWSRVLVSDLVIPSNGQLVPGSGSIYIGGPRLPVGLKNVYKGAIVFFSDAGGLAAGIDYWYIAHFGSDIAPFTSDGLQTGYYPTGGPATVATMGSFITVPGGVQTTVIEAIDNVLVQSDAIQLNATGTGPAIIRLTAPNGTNIVIGEGVGVGQPRLEVLGWNTGAGLDIYIKGSDGRQDIWYSEQIVQAIGGQTMTADIDWRCTPDYVLDIRGRIAFNAVPATFDFNFVVNIPWTIDAGPSNGVGMATFGDSAGVGVPRTIRTFMGGPGNQIYVQGGAGNPSGYQFNFFSMIGTVLKP